MVARRGRNSNKNTVNKQLEAFSFRIARHQAKLIKQNLHAIIILHLRIRGSSSLLIGPTKRGVEDRLQNIVFVELGARLDKVQIVAATQTVKS